MTTNQALSYIYENKKGLMQELRDKVDHNIILDFELTGIIQKGQESSRENSWKITEEGRELFYVANMETMYKPSTFERFQGFINGLILDKKMINA